MDQPTQNKQGFINVISIIVTVVVVLVLGYFAFSKKSEAPQNGAPDNVSGVQIPSGTDGGGGAGGSGLPDNPPASVNCVDYNLPTPQNYGTVLQVSSDETKVFWNNKVILEVKQLPTRIRINSDSSFDVTNQGFTNAVLSPTKSIVAFIVNSGIHRWAGIKNLQNGSLYPVAFQFEGGIDKPIWNKVGNYISFFKATPKGTNILSLVNTDNTGIYTSDFEKILIKKLYKNKSQHKLLILVAEIVDNQYKIITIIETSKIKKYL